MRNVLAVLAIFLVSLIWTGAASAHASLVSTSPARDSVVAEAPATLVLTFNEPVSPLVLTLVTPKGTALPLADYTMDSSAVMIAAPPGLGEGSFVLSYRVVSEDGHPVAGSIIFAIGAPSATATEVLDQIDWPVRLAIWAGKVGLYSGLLLGVGGVFFFAWTAGQPHTGARLQPLLGLGLVAASFSIGLQGLDALGLHWDGLWQLKTWSTGFSTSFGPSAAIAIASMLLAWVAPYTLGRAISLVAFAGIGLALAATGHASAAEPQWLTRPAVFVHAVSVAYWIGALLPLWVMLRSRMPEAITALRRFSRIIPFALLALIASGITLAIIQIGGPEAIFTTAYGLVFALKMALVITLILLAAINRWWLTQRVEQGESQATRHLLRMLAVEMLLALAILGTVATWRFTPPPRALVPTVAMAPAPLALMVHSDQAMIDIELSSARAGPLSADIVLMGADMGPLDAQALTVELSNPAAGIEPLTFPAEKQPDGHWRIADMMVPMPGQWQLDFGIRISDFALVRAATTVDFAP